MKKFVMKLAVLDGPAKGSSYTLSEGQNTVGRGEDNTVCILDRSLSKRHCQIVNSVGRFYIIDLNSRNGTFLNGIRLLPNKMYKVKDRSEITIGVSLLRVGIEELEAEDYDLEGPTMESEVGERGVAPRAYVPRVKREPTLEVRKAAPPKTMTFNIGSSRNLLAIYRLLSTVGTATDAEFMIRSTLDIVMDSIESERGYILLKQDQGDELVSRAFKVKGQRVSLPPSEISTTAVNMVRESKDSILSVEPLDDSRFLGSKSVEHLKIKSILCAPVKSKEELLGVIYLDTTHPAQAFEADDVELLSAFGILFGTLLENRKLFADNQDLFLGVVKALINIVEEKDKYTFGHSERVTAISVEIAKELRMGTREVEDLRVSALLHDIGKIVVPEEILNKPGRLTDEEFGQIKKHPAVGKRFVGHMKKFTTLLDGIMSHHERFDGRGYPEGLAGEKIPLAARIIAVADTFDAMTSDRAYRKSLGEEAALQEILKNQGMQFDGRMVRAFHEALKKGNIPH